MEHHNISTPCVTLTNGSTIALPVVDKYGDGRLTVDSDRYTVRMYCKYTRQVESLGLLVIPEGSAGRQENGGPEVPGPWGGTFALPTVISAHPGKSPDILIHVVQEGAQFWLGGHVYAIRDDRPMNYPRLVAVKPLPSESKGA